jgi:putative transposase
MLRENPLVTGETYHIYNRGAHKQDIFKNPEDYSRFLVLLYLSNNSEPIHISKLSTTPKYQGRSLLIMLEEEKPNQSLVDVMAYCLMPNHFHLVLKQKVEGGITLFMKRLLTGYSMYFNIRHEHSGVLFQGRFKSKCILHESYFRYIFSYIHLNPIELIEVNWKEDGLKNPTQVRNFLRRYQYSSFYDYSVSKRPARAILAYESVPDFLRKYDDLEDLLKELTSSRTVLDGDFGARINA